MKNIIEKYRKWKKRHPDEGYQIDEIYQFMTDDLTNGEIVEIFEYLDNELTYQDHQRKILNAP